MKLRLFVLTWILFCACGPVVVTDGEIAACKRLCDKEGFTIQTGMALPVECCCNKVIIGKECIELKTLITFQMRQKPCVCEDIFDEELRKEK